MPHRFPLTAFADEISPDLAVQIENLAQYGLQGLDLRSVGGVNVMDLEFTDLQRVHDACAERGLRVQSIGSPINKVRYDVMNQATELDRLKRAVKIAEVINVKRVRVFTPEVPENQHEELTPKVISWMAEQRRVAEDHGIILLHENDGRYWGAYPQNCKRLLEALGNPNFRAIFDFANSTLLGYRPLEHWLSWLLPHLDTLHIKDAVRAEGKVVPAGHGDGQIIDALRFLISKDWDGMLTLEPHLQSAGPYGGFSGEGLFEVAVTALRSVLALVGGEA